jgi:hypothetical protein
MLQFILLLQAYTMYTVTWVFDIFYDFFYTFFFQKVTRYIHNASEPPPPVTPEIHSMFPFFVFFIFINIISHNVQLKFDKTLL